MPTPRLILLDGCSGAGKSTLVPSLQEALLPEIWLGFSMDTLIYLLPPSVLQRCNLADDWSGVDGRALGAAALKCVQTLLDQGQRVIFDLVVPSGRFATEFLATVEAHPKLIIGLDCPWEEIKRRTLQRADRSLAEAERTWKMHLKFLSHDLILDTSTLTPAEAATKCRDIVTGVGVRPA